MTGDFFNAVVLSTAKRIATLFISGNVIEANKQLEMHLGELDAANGAAFISKVQQFIEGAKAS